MSKSVYIAGKMRGVPYYNFPAFDAARDRLKALGLEVFSPADMDRANGFDPWKYADSIGLPVNEIDWSHVPESFDLDAAIKRDNEKIKKADATCVLHEGFAESVGATEEVELTMKLGKIVIFDTMTDEQIAKALGMEENEVFAPLRILNARGKPGILGDNMTAETRYTDPTTGGQKGEKLARFDLLPPDVLWELAEHYGKGARKYADRNMEKGYPWSKSYTACQRHLNAFWNGEDIDAETGSLHLISAAWHCFTMAWFYRHKAGTDNRPNT